MVSLSKEIIFKCLDVTEVNSASSSSLNLYKLILLRLRVTTIMRSFDVAATVHILSYIVSAAFSYHIANTIFQGRKLFRIDPIKAFHCSEENLRLNLTLTCDTVVVAVFIVHEQE